MQIIKIMKKSFFTLSILSAAISAMSMQFYCGEYDAANRNVKWSNCIWGNNVNFKTEPLKGKPGPADSVTVRPGCWNFEIDGNYNVGTFHTGDGSTSIAKGRNFKVKRRIRISIACYNAGMTKQKWERCSVEGGSYEVTFWTEAKSAGKAHLSLSDTKFNIKGDFICTIPANPIIKNAIRAGVEVLLEGASDMQFGGGAMIDSIIADENDQWFFKWTFKEKDGKVPHALFNRRAQFAKCDIEVDVSDKVKSGKYGLIEFADKRSGITAPRSVVVNGAEVKLGDTFKVGKRTGKVYLGAFGKDSKTENDLVLEISK